MRVRLKKLNIVNDTSVKLAVAVALQFRLNDWWVPRQMQAAMWELGAQITEVKAADLMEQLFQSNTLTVYEKRLTPTPRYKCKAVFTPNKN